MLRLFRVEIEEDEVIYHTFIETCKMCGISTLEYLKEFFKAAIKRVQFRIYSRKVKREQVRLIIKAIMQGRTDERSKYRINMFELCLARRRWRIAQPIMSTRLCRLLPSECKNMLPMTIGIKK